MRYSWLIRSHSHGADDSFPICVSDESGMDQSTCGIAKSISSRCGGDLCEAAFMDEPDGVALAGDRFFIFDDRVTCTIVFDRKRVQHLGYAAEVRRTHEHNKTHQYRSKQQEFFHSFFFYPTFAPELRIDLTAQPLRDMIFRRTCVPPILFGHAKINCRYSFPYFQEQGE